MADVTGAVGAEVLRRAHPWSARHVTCRQSRLLCDHLHRLSPLTRTDVRRRSERPEPEERPWIPETQHKVIDVPKQVGFASQAGA